MHKLYIQGLSVRPLGSQGASTALSLHAFNATVRLFWTETIPACARPGSFWEITATSFKAVSTSPWFWGPKAVRNAMGYNTIPHQSTEYAGPFQPLSARPSDLPGAALAMCLSV